ncbi:FAD:protein FMN transferase [Phytohabitans sp. ZYX-F-186]|uniref:FAD:protein FMN transferase n=1 Tax=Phytohabitans maris TaxID=3071409 RepID=A0ABU0ZPA6_9ACTN|nr:FAD:protein FMN transferase [Phytohabitans sp. ZYX-F-186]MDQ7908845.1 FAD:protein FMN transferase [Phytohabitans sp. ZYX-F-186]
MTDPAVARRARRLVSREVAAANTALTRELPRVTLAAGRPVHLSPVLADLVRAALDAAALTDGAVDPTVGTALLRSGARPPARGPASQPPRRSAWQPPRGSARPAARDSAWLPACGSAVGVLETRRHTWRDVQLDAGWLTLPHDVVLDLNATAPARTADRCAALVAARYGVGAMVAVGGDVATAGPTRPSPHPDGWPLPASASPATAGTSPTATRGSPATAGTAPTATGGWPTAASGWPTAASGWPTAASGWPTAASGWPTAASGWPTAASGWPATGGWLATTGASPTAAGGWPAAMRAAAARGWPAAVRGWPAAVRAWPAAVRGRPAAVRGRPAGCGGSPAVLPAGRALGTSRSALVEPLTGLPAPQTGRAVVVEAADALTASALATAVSLRPETPIPQTTTVRRSSAP